MEYVRYSDLSEEDKLHDDIREWIEEQGFPPHSLDELIFSNDFEKEFMTKKQREEAQEFMDAFDLLP